MELRREGRKSAEIRAGIRRNLTTFRGGDHAPIPMLTLSPAVWICLATGRDPLAALG